MNKNINVGVNIDHSQAMQKLRELQRETERLKQSFATNAPANVLNNQLRETSGILSTLSNQMKYLASAGILGGVVGLPMSGLERLKELDTQRAGMLQVAPELLNKDHSVNQRATNDAMREFIALAEEYGAKTKEIFEASKLWGRGYKDLATVKQLTAQSAKLAVADNMSIELANRSVEGIISAYQRYSSAVQFATKITDVFTQLAHGTQVSAADLSESLIRSAGSAHVVGVEFEQLSALAASMVKNTGLGGATVGQGLKSIFASIRSDKAVAELEKFGVASYKVGSDGAKSFRPVIDVLSEVMIKAKGTNEDMQKLVLAMSGGKFQSSKLASVLGSYDDYIKNYTLALTAAGATDRQVAYQLDTIQRKITQISSAFDGLMQNMASNGLSKAIREWLDSARAFIHGLQSIPAEGYKTIAFMGTAALSLYALSTALTFLQGGMTRLAVFMPVVTAEIAAEGVAAGAAAVPTGVLATATTALTGGLNLLLAGLVASGVGLTAYAAYQGTAASASDDLLAKQQALLQTRQEELETIPKQTEFIGTLAHNYIALSDQLIAVQGNSERTQAIQESMQVTQQQLTLLVGEESAARLTAQGVTEETINAEMSKHSEKTAQLTTEIQQINAAINAHTDAAISAAEARITALESEGAALGIYAQIVESTLQDCAAMWSAYIKAQQFVYNALPESQLKNSLGRTIDDNILFGATIERAGNAPRAEAIEQAKYDLAMLRKKRISAMVNTGGTAPAKFGGDDVAEDGGGKGRSSGKHSQQQHIDPSYAREYNAVLNEGREAAEKFQSAMETLNFQEELFGKTSVTSANKLQLLSGRMEEISSQAKKEKELLQKYDGEISKSLGNDWQSLSEEEQRSDDKNINKLIELHSKLKVSIAQSSKDFQRISNDKLREQYNSPKSLYQQAIDEREVHRQLQMGYKDSPELKRTIELKAAMDELIIAQDELKRLQDLPDKNIQDLHKQEAAVHNLKNRVEELANTYKDKVSEGFASMTEDILLNSRSLSDILGNEMKKLASDAIKSMFGIKQAQSSIFGNAAMGKGGGKGGASVPGLGGAKYIAAGMPLSAEGGIWDQPVIAGEDGEEVVIPTNPKNSKNSAALLGYANAKIGSPLTKGQEYTPYFKNPNLGAAQVNVQVQQQQAHIRLLEQQVQIQTATLEHLLNSNQGNGNVIIAGGTSDQQILEAIKRNPDAINAMNGRRRGSGFR